VGAGAYLCWCLFGPSPPTTAKEGWILHLELLRDSFLEAVDGRRSRILGLIISKKYSQPLGAVLPLPSPCSCTLLGFGSLASSSNKLVGGPNTQLFMRDLV